MLLIYHIGCIVLALPCAVRLGWYLGYRLKHSTANVVVQQHSRKLLKMDILMHETC